MEKCCVQLDQQEKKTQPPVLLNAVYSGSFSLQLPQASGYKRFYPLKPQPRLNQSPQVTSPHQAGLLSQSGIKGEPSTKYGLVYCLAQISVQLARESGMASHIAISKTLQLGFTSYSLLSWCQTSTTLHDPCPELSIATESAPSKAFHCLPHCRASS